MLPRGDGGTVYIEKSRSVTEKCPQTLFGEGYEGGIRGVAQRYAIVAVQFVMPDEVSQIIDVCLAS